MFRRRMGPIAGITAIAIMGAVAMGGATAEVEVQKDWVPPKAALPKEFVDAVGTVFDHGIADPRAGDFREATISFSGKFKAKVSGWVLPSSDGGKKMVLCWNGLEYEAFAVGPKLDLATFVDHERTGPSRLPFYTGRSEPAEAGSPRSVLGVALLVRLGRMDLAEGLVASMQRRTDLLVPDLGEDVLWFRFNRAVQAHSLGDDRLALSDGLWLKQNKASLDRFREKAGPISPEMSYDPVDLVADSLRRIDRGPRAALNLAALKRQPIDRQISEIVDHLDEARGESVQVPGGIDWRSVPIYRAAVAVGPPIVDKLIDCAEADQRLTMSAESGRPWWRQRRLVGVREIAAMAVRDILKLRFAPGSKEGLEKLRALAKMPNPADRYRAVLSDSSAGRDLWVEAALGLAAVPAVSKTAQPPTGHGAADTDMIAKRCLDTMPIGRWPSSKELFAAKDAVRMAEAGAKCDAAGFRPTLLILSRRLADTIAAFDQYTPADWIDEAEGMLGILGRLRLMAGDSSAKADYEAWIYRSAPHVLGSQSYDRFRPLIENSSWGDTVARKLFLGDSAAWNPAVALRAGNFMPLDSLLRSRLLMLPSVRESLVAAMADATVIGEVWRIKDGGTKFKTARGGGGIGPMSRDAEIRDPRDPGDEVKRPLRVGDYVAMKLSSFRGAPQFRAYWSDGDRNEALSQMIRFVRQDGASFVDRRPWKEPGER